MQLKKKLSFIVMMLLFIVPSVSFVFATDTSEYVGIEEGDEFIWDVEVHDSVMKDYYEDTNPTLEKEVIDIIVSDMFSGEMDEDVEAWKMVILQIKDEKEERVGGEEYKAVPYYFNSYYKKGDSGDWRKVLKYYQTNLYKYDKEFYEGITPYADFRGFDPLTNRIVSKDINWKNLVNEADENLEESLDNEGGARPATESVAYTFKQTVDGITCFYKEGEHRQIEDVGEWESTSIYNDNGILKYHEWLYDGDPIMIVELQENWFVSNWWIIAIIAAGAVVVILVFTILKKR